MLKRHALVIVALLLGGIEQAEAMCAYLPRNGAASTSIPTRGSLYVYDGTLGSPTEHRQEVSWRGSVGVATEVKVSDTIVRIDYEGEPGSELIVNRVRYPLVPEWRAPTRAPRLLRYWHQLNRWTCSRTDSLRIEIDQPTAAIRARWTHEGKSTEWLFPAPGSASTSELELGKINCGGTTLPPSELRTGGHLELTAIRFDGSEVPVAGLPGFIFTAMLPVRGTDQEEEFVFHRAEAPKRSTEYVYASAVFVLLAGAVFALRRARERATKSM